eukprot:TRINITY_DN6414_c0_g1_i1.p1 TRINITY_DN6414_c0_g1~~TRINITY_DN6414_c0_g1_i1.p1  ORF type:complete len:379 (+),score=90.58 TRINITY_DN6414_c0_g1_i1:158-1294(+)
MSSSSSNSKRDLPSSPQQSSAEAKRAKQLAKQVVYFGQRHEASSESAATIGQNVNKQLTDILMQVGINEKNIGAHHKFNAYVKAVNSIKRHPHKLTSGAEAQKLEGVGAKIAKKIDEIIQTGKLDKLELAKNDPVQRALNELTGLHGVGPVKAREWVAAGIMSLDELRRRIEAKSVTLTREQEIGLKYHDAFQERIPRAEVEQHEQLVKRVCADVDPRLSVAVVGSYRRGKETCGDVDVLVTHPEFGRRERQSKSKSTLVKRIVDALQSSGYHVASLSTGVVKHMGVCALPGGKPRRLDIKLFPHEALAAALLHFTGSGESNRTLRAHALALGMTLSEFGLAPVGQTGHTGAFVQLDNEKDIYRWLDMPYMPPHERNL